jgi:hypothetical protein
VEGVLVSFSENKTYDTSTIIVMLVIIAEAIGNVDMIRPLANATQLNHNAAPAASVPDSPQDKPKHLPKRTAARYAAESGSFWPTLAASKSSAFGVPSGPSSTAGSFALSRAFSASSPSASSSPPSAAYPAFSAAARAAAAPLIFQLARRAITAAIPAAASGLATVGEVTGVLSSSSGAALSGGRAVSRKACTGAAARGWCGKWVGTTVREAAAAGLEEGEMASGGETVSSPALEGVLGLVGG